MKINVLFAGGGTGGHLFPAIAVAEALRALMPDIMIHFIGRTDKIEATVVPAHGFQFHPIMAEGFSRSNPLRNIRVAAKFAGGFIQCLNIAMKYKPAVVVTTGAYISAPMIIAARIMGAKVLMIEPNSYPGLTTRLLESSAEAVYIAFEETKKYLRQPDKAILSGNPIRHSFAVMDRAQAKQQLGFDPQKKLLVVSGGSLGARALNSAVQAVLHELEARGINCLWQTGKGYYEKYRALQSDTVSVVPFIADMAVALNAADVLLCRSGATTVAEIAALGIASLLVPSPNVAENHQYFNAKSLVDRGAAVLLEEKELNDRLASVLAGMMNDEHRLATIRENALHIHTPGVAEQIAAKVQAILGGRG